VEHDDLADSGRDKISMSLGNGPHVQVADRAARVPAELQVDHMLGIGDADRLAVDGGQFAAAQDVSRVQLGDGTCRLSLRSVTELGDLNAILYDNHII